MKVKFLLPAQLELDDAVDWYTHQIPDLGREFLDELDKVIRRIVLFPESGTKNEYGLRRCLLSRFPYGVIYNLDEETVVVIAVAHLHREPRYWIERISLPPH